MGSAALLGSGGLAGLYGMGKDAYNWLSTPTDYNSWLSGANSGGFTTSGAGADLTGGAGFTMPTF